MPGTTATVEPHRAGAHGLLVADTDRERRVGASAWLDRQLGSGAKVYYKGWLGEGQGPDEHWIVGPRGARTAPRALASGQLEILGFPEVIARCGGTTDGLRALLRGEVERAVGDGWPRVAMSQESPRRPMADEHEATEYAAQEATFDDLARRWPLTTLCQLTLDEENPAARRESAAVHHAGIVDPQWSCTLTDRRWWLRGTVDAHVTERFGAALHGALRSARSASTGPDLHVDLSGVAFADLAFAQTLFRTARAVAERQRLVLHGCSPFLARVLEAVGRPGNVVLVGEGAS